jgi:hypothetical protein
MRCKTPRKGPRRRPQKAAVDDELSELAAVIAEYTLDNNAENWFKLPWRNGWNAVELAARSAGDDEDPWLLLVCAKRIADQGAYWNAQDQLSTTVTPSRMLRAALRCLQVLIANSSGGGAVYNAILRGPFEAQDPERVSDLVLEYRCRDSIGTTAVMQGDTNDRLRKAFSIAWGRGLYMAAYSLPPATVAGQLKVVI